MPRSDWLPMYPGSPMRSPWNTSFVQYSFDAPGAITHVTSAHPANVATARPAARKSRRTRKNRTNASGVSFTAAASPTR